MGYMDKNNRNITQECKNVVKFAFSMIDTIDEVNQLQNCELNMRIGIHTGIVIAGVTGTQIVRYDIYGPDVLIANKMESQGEAGRINVSDITKEILEKDSPDLYQFEENCIVEA
jgi:class 3 adenylate cyclase